MEKNEIEISEELKALMLESLLEKFFGRECSKTGFRTNYGRDYDEISRISREAEQYFSNFDLVSLKEYLEGKRGYIDSLTKRGRIHSDMVAIISVISAIQAKTDAKEFLKIYTEACGEVFHD